MEEATDVKRKMTPSIPANYVSIIQLRERWIKEKGQKQRKEQEEEERRRNQHAEEQQKIEEDDPKKPREDLDETRSNQSDRKKHWGGNSKKDESTDGGEARCGEEEAETAAIDEGLPVRRGRRKRYDRKKKKKRTNQEVEECGSITVKEINNTTVKDQIRVYKKKEAKAVTAIETQFKHLSIQRGQETKKLKAQARSLNRIPIETAAAMVWVKKGEQNERAVDGNGSGVKPLYA